MDRQYLYYYYRADGVPLYVGRTNDPERREAKHRAKSKWWPDVDQSRTELVDVGVVPVWRVRQLERAEIERLRPLANSQHNGMRGRLYRAGDRRWRDPQPGDELVELLFVFGPVLFVVAAGVFVAGCSIVFVVR